MKVGGLVLGIAMIAGGVAGVISGALTSGAFRFGLIGFGVGLVGVGIFVFARNFSGKAKLSKIDGSGEKAAFVEALGLSDLDLLIVLLLLGVCTGLGIGAGAIFGT